MLHLGPGASRKRVPPSPDVPSGNTLGSITRRSHKSPTACSPRASTIPGSLSLASSGHFHAARPGGRRFPPPRFRSASPPPASPPTPRREEAPRPGLRHHVRASHHASGPPRLPPRSVRRALRESRSCHPHRRLARPPPGATASSAPMGFYVKFPCDFCFGVCSGVLLASQGIRNGFRSNLLSARHRDLLR
jgi:hypothetical protein